MIYTLFLLILIVFCLSMFFIPRSYKLAVMLVTLACLTMVKIPSIPFGTCTYIIPICFFLSESRSLLQHIAIIKEYFLGKLLLLVIVATTIAYFTSPHYAGSATGAVQLIIRDFIVKYFAVAYAFVCVYEDDDMRPTLSLTYYALIILTLFGIANLIDHHSYLVDALASVTRNTTDTDALGGRYEGIERFRVQSMFFNPFDYGYICLILLLLHAWGYLKGLESKFRFYLVIACTIFGLVACNCRTILFSVLIGGIVFMIIYKEQTGRMRYILFSSLGLMLLFAFIPPVQRLIYYIFSIFQSNAGIAGSSLEMRMIQYTRVLYYWNGHEWFGHGIDYFWIDLGWSGGKETAVDKDLFGLEGVVMTLLLERGLVGLVSYFIFYSILCYQIYKLRHLDNTTAAWGLSTLLAYLVFANMTGELLSVFPTLLIVGGVISLLYQKEEEGEEYEPEDEEITESAPYIIQET